MYSSVQSRVVISIIILIVLRMIRTLLSLLKIMLFLNVLIISADHVISLEKSNIWFHVLDVLHLIIILVYLLICQKYLRSLYSVPIITSHYLTTNPNWLSNSSYSQKKMMLLKMMLLKSKELHKGWLKANSKSESNLKRLLIMI